MFGEFCNFCRLLNNNPMKNTISKINTMAVITPINTSYWSLSLAVTKKKERNKWKKKGNFFYLLKITMLFKFYIYFNVHFEKKIYCFHQSITKYENNAASSLYRTTKRYNAFYTNALKYRWAVLTGWEHLTKFLTKESNVIQKIKKAFLILQKI